MAEIYIVQNQDGLYLDKHNGWCDGSDAGLVFKTEHRDIALNSLIELNAKDIGLRGKLVTARLNDRGLPELSPAGTEGNPMMPDAPHGADV